MRQKCSITNTAPLRGKQGTRSRMHTYHPTRNLPFTAPPVRRRSEGEVSGVGSCVLQCAYVMYTVLEGQFFNVGAR